MSYLKPYNHVQTKDCYYIEIITWNHKTKCKLLVLVINTLIYNFKKPCFDYLYTILVKLFPCNPSTGNKTNQKQ